MKSRADNEYWERPDRNTGSKWSFHRSGPAQKPVGLHVPGPTRCCSCFLGWRNPADGGVLNLPLCAHFVGRNGYSSGWTWWPSFFWVHSYRLQLSTAGKRGLVLTPKQLGKVTSSGLHPFRKTVDRQAASTTDFFGLVGFLHSFGLVCCQAWFILAPDVGRSVTCFGPSTEDQCFSYE